jgi:predicted LPLAT superfamily acyltransferase
MNQENNWAFIKEKGTLTGMKIMLIAYRIGGSILCRIFLFPVVFFYFLFKPDLRKNSIDYLLRVEKKIDNLPKVNFLLSFRHFLEFGSSLIDKFSVWMGEIKIDQVNIHGSELFDELISNKQGAVIITSHLGNTEVSSALSQTNPQMNLTILQYTKHAQKFNFLLDQLKMMSNIKMLQVTDLGISVAMKLDEKVRRGEFIAISGDRLSINHPEASVTCNFFNRPADFPNGPYVLANILQVPIMLLICVKHKGKYNIYFEELTKGQKISKKGRQDFIKDSAQLYAERLEYYTSQNPLQWFNFFEFWKKR